MERAVSFTKGCYTGQELVARLDARGNKVARRLCGVVIEPPDDLDPDTVVGLLDGAVMRTGADHAEAKALGTLTSVARCPGLDALPRGAGLRPSLAGRARCRAPRSPRAGDLGPLEARVVELPMVPAHGSTPLDLIRRRSAPVPRRPRCPGGTDAAVPVAIARGPSGPACGRPPQVGVRTAGVPWPAATSSWRCHPRGRWVRWAHPAPMAGQLGHDGQPQPGSLARRPVGRSQVAVEDPSADSGGIRGRRRPPRAPPAIRRPARHADAPAANAGRSRSGWPGSGRSRSLSARPGAGPRARREVQTEAPSAAGDRRRVADHLGGVDGAQRATGRRPGGPGRAGPSPDARAAPPRHR